MAITKVTRTLLSTGIDDQSNATAITINSSEQVGIGGSPDAMLKVTHTIDSETAIFENARTANNGTDSVDVRIRSVNRFANLFITSKNVRSSAIKFGDEDDDDIGQLIYDNSDNSMQFVTNTSEAMRIDSSGNVGIGVTSVSDKLQILGGGSSNTTGITLTNNNGTDNIGNSITFRGSYGAPFSTDNIYARISGLITSYTGSKTGNLVFSTGSNNSISERMRIDSSGTIAIGGTNASPQPGENVAYHLATDGYALYSGVNATTSRNHAVFGNPNGYIGSITTNGSSTAYNTSSDARLKDVTGKARGLKVINELNPVAYNWKESGQADEGLIAQEVLNIVPNAVSGSEEEMYQMDYSKLVVHLVAGMKEQQTIIDNLTTRIETLENA